MPWTNDEVPDQVKVLPSEAKKIWVSAANNSLKDNDESVAVKIGWAAVKNAGWENKNGNWVKKKSEPESYEFEAEIFSKGTWDGDEFTLKDLDNMVYNFNSLKDEVKPFLKLGHHTGQKKDGQPALGWVDSVKRSGEKLVAKFKNVPKLVYDAIKLKRYKRISCEIYFNYKDLTGNVRNKVLRAVSLLGADVPEVKDLQDIAIFLSQNDQTDAFDELKFYEFDKNLGFLKLTTFEKGVKKMTDEKIKKMEESLKKSQDEVEKEKSARKKVEDKLKEYKEGEEKKAEEIAKKEFKTFCEDKVKNKTMSPGQRDKLLKDYVYSEGNLLISFKTFKAFCENKEMIISFKEVGIGDKDEDDYTNVVNVSQIVDEKVEKYMEKHEKVSYEDAMDVVLKTNPKLADKYLKD